MNRTPPPRTNIRPALLTALAFAALLGCAGIARAAEGDGWSLPANYSEHGKSMDALFWFIFWLTTITMIGVFVVMAYFLIKYRHNPERKKAYFTHGNPRLEMAWTIAPAIILCLISLMTKGVWDRYRYGDADEKREIAEILVIGQQFKWNVVYPGPDRKFGRYLAFPKPTDREWPRDDKNAPVEYAGVKGPADLPFDKAVTAINQYIDEMNPLGKVFNDPDGKDDNWDKQPGREINIPVNRPVRVHLSSKDVIHSFYLPNFRVKLDAVPGLRGSVNFVPTVTSKSREADPANRRTYAVADLPAVLKRPENAELLIAIDDKTLPKAADAKSPGAFYDKKSRQWKFNDKGGETIIRDAAVITPEAAESLKQIGVKDVIAYRPGYFELVCEELCGGQHYTMRGTVVVLSEKEFKEQFETKAEEEADAGDIAPLGPAAVSTR